MIIFKITKINVKSPKTKHKKPNDSYETFKKNAEYKQGTKAIIA